MEWCRDIWNIYVLLCDKFIINNSGIELKFWVFYFYSCIWNKNVKKNKNNEKEKKVFNFFKFDWFIFNFLIIFVIYF